MIATILSTRDTSEGVLVSLGATSSAAKGLTLLRRKTRDGLQWDVVRGPKRQWVDEALSWLTDGDEKQVCGLLDALMTIEQQQART